MTKWQQSISVFLDTGWAGRGRQSIRGEPTGLLIVDYDEESLLALERVLWFAFSPNRHSLLRRKRLLRCLVRFRFIFLGYSYGPQQFAIGSRDDHTRCIVVS